jgi:polyisoprenoid-binding protein YceI
MDMRTWFWLLLVAAFCSISFDRENPNPGKWNIDPARSEITFQIKNFGFTVTGKLEGLKGDISFDEGAPEASSITASVDVNTINTGIDARDRHLKSSDYFDADKYPKIVFQSTKIEKKSGKFVMTGKLGIRSTIKTLSFPFTFAQIADKGIFRAEFDISRAEFGVGASGSPIGDKVRVTLVVAVEKE